MTYESPAPADVWKAVEAHLTVVAALAELMARNEANARAIEDAWSACGILTAVAHLRDQLARKRLPRS